MQGSLAICFPGTLTQKPQPYSSRTITKLSVDIIAALKTGFSYCQKSITLVEAYCAGILIIHREPDTHLKYQ